MTKDKKTRCFPTKPGKTEYENYHDHEWCTPVHHDQKHFEMLILEGAQAGLNWETILKKRQGYRDAFYQFDPHQCAQMSDAYLEKQMQNTGIIRNRLKIFSVRQNANIFLKIQKEYGTFDDYIWPFVKGKPIYNHWETFEDVPASTPESILLSKDLHKRGMRFVGPTIIYAYMQAIGMVNDHLTSCWKYGMIEK